LAAADIHGSISAARRLVELAELRRPQLVVLLGDLFEGGWAGFGQDETARILSGLPVPAAVVQGNCDSESQLGLLPWPMLERIPIDCGQAVFLAIHGHQLRTVERLLGPIDILSGHTHTPRAESTPEGRRWNPGSAGLPKADWPPSYGWFEDGVFRVLDLETDELLLEDRLDRL
jgi:putative phosphoesterase